MALSKRREWLRVLNERENFPMKLLEDSSNIFCRVCEKAVGANMKSQLHQHLQGSKHKKNMDLKRANTSLQSSIEECAKKQPVSKADLMGRDLCEALTAANVPLRKLENPKLQAFFSKYLGIELPSESTFRRKYMVQNYQKVSQSC